MSAESTTRSLPRWSRRRSISTGPPRAQRLTGPEIAERLGLPASTDGRLLTQASQGRLKAPPVASGLRYQSQISGEFVHVEIKSLDHCTAMASH